jgi:TatD DNase family protein
MIMKLIDIHTHRANDTLSIQILNVFAQNLPDAELNSLFSGGLHPWDIDLVNPEECMKAIERFAAQKNMLAIGECGLDRIITTDFAMQEQYFRQQIEIAEKYGKPLIIHCVRAYSDLMKFKKTSKSDLPWIIHGYAGNLDITQSLIRHNFYFSAGERLLKDSRKHDVLRAIPADRLFLETDDGDTSIAEIYAMAAQVLEMDQETLIQNVANNFERIFGNVYL